MQKIAVASPGRDPHPHPDPPLVIANLPASARLQRIAFGLIVVLLAVFAIMSPFAGTRLARVDSFVPAIQSVMCIADLFTALLLFAQYSIQPQRGLLALASAYISSGLFAFLQALAFPGSFAPTGLLGGGQDTASWLFVLWHTTFPIAVAVYALWKDANDESSRSGQSITFDIVFTVAITCTLTGALTLLVTAGAEYLPALYVGGVTQQAPFANQVNVFMFVLHAIALVALFLQRRTILNTWLIVTVVAWMPAFIVAVFMIFVRFSLGWYTARIYALIASCVVLGVLLAETMVLYRRLASAFALLQRERTNGLMSVEAATSAMAHELRQPLSAITSRGSAALNWVKREPPDLERARECLTSIVESGRRADEIISSVVALFKRSGDQRAMLHVGDIVRQVLTLVRHDLHVHQIAVTVEYEGTLPQISADRRQLQQVILNLVRNAIYAMGSTEPHARHLRLVTRLNGNSTAVLSVQDSGLGIAYEDQDRVFEPFFTTKPSGMGLGLAICRTIIEDHGGSLWLVRSNSEGTIFEIALPIESKVSAATAVR